MKSDSTFFSRSAIAESAVGAVADTVQSDCHCPDPQTGYIAYVGEHERRCATLPTTSPREDAIAKELGAGVTEESLLADARRSADSLPGPQEARDRTFELFAGTIRRRHDGLSTVVPANIPALSFDRWVELEGLREQREAEAALMASQRAEEARKRQAEAVAREEAAKEADRKREASQSEHNRFLQRIGRPNDRLDADTGRDSLGSYLQIRARDEHFKDVGSEPVGLSPSQRLRWLKKHVIDHQSRGGYPVSALSLVEAGFADVPVQWLVESLIPRGHLGLVHGPPRTLKGFFELSVAIALTSETPLFGSARFRVLRPCRVLYLSGEDSEILVTRRVQELTRGAGLSAQQVLGDLHIRCVREHFRFARHQDEVDTASRFVEQIRGWVRALDIGFVVIGPLRALFPSHVDKAAEDSAPLIAAFRDLADDCDIPVLFDTHDVKGAKDITDRYARANLASGGGLYSGTDWPIGLRRIKGSPSEIEVIPEGFKMTEPPDRVRLLFEHGPGWCRFVTQGAVARQAQMDDALSLIRTRLAAGEVRSARSLAKELSLPRSAVDGSLARLKALGRWSVVPMARRNHGFSSARQVNRRRSDARSVEPRPLMSRRSGPQQAGPTPLRAVGLIARTVLTQTIRVTGQWQQWTGPRTVGNSTGFLRDFVVGGVAFHRGRKAATRQVACARATG